MWDVGTAGEVNVYRWEVVREWSLDGRWGEGQEGGGGLEVRDELSGL